MSEMEKASASDAQKAYRLRQLKKDGKLLTPEETAWLDDYTVKHPYKERPRRKAIDDVDGSLEGINLGQSGNDPSAGVSEAAVNGQKDGNGTQGATYNAEVVSTAEGPQAKEEKKEVDPKIRDMAQKLAAQVCQYMQRLGHENEKLGGFATPDFILEVILGPAVQRQAEQALPSILGNVESTDTIDLWSIGIICGGTIGQHAYLRYAEKKAANNGPVPPPRSSPNPTSRPIPREPTLPPAPPPPEAPKRPTGPNPLDMDF